MNPAQAPKPPKIALVTGATRGIGRAIAERLAREPFRVALLARNPEDLASLESRLNASGRSAMAIACDVSREEDVRSALSRIQAEWGPPSILVNNAGIGGPFHRADEVSPAEWRSILSTNLDGPFHLSRLLLPGMKEQGFGRIINISSVQGLFGGALSSTYAATKHALVGYTRSIAAEWGRYGVTCNAICPGYTETDMLRSAPAGVRQELLKRIPSGRFGQPEEIAELAAHLAGPLGAYINGSTLVVDGGLSAHLAGTLPEF